MCWSMGRTPPKLQPPGSDTSARPQRPQEVIGGAQRLCQLVGNHRFPDLGGIDLHCSLIQQTHLGAQLPQDIEQCCYIADVGDIFNDADIPCQNSSRNDGHHRIFGSADGDITLEDCASGNYILFHSHSLLYDHTVSSFINRFRSLRSGSSSVS